MDRIFYNGDVRTMDRWQPAAQAVAVKDGLILRVGSDEEILALKTEATELVDLSGRLMVPGFHDSHIHLMSYGLSLEKVNLGEADSIEDIVALGSSFLRQRIEENGGAMPEGWWLQGRGWNNDYWNENRFPTRYDLDRITEDYPVTYTRACGHIIVVNSRALQLMGVGRDTPQIAGGQIDMDETGEPLGIFREAARDIVYNAIPRLSVPRIQQIASRGAEQMLRCGITAIQSDDFEAVPEAEYQNVIDALTQLSEEGRLPIKIFEQCLLPPLPRLKEFLGKGYRTEKNGGGRFRIGPLKLLADGSLGGRTAYLSRPYADDPSTCGIPVFSQEELNELIATAHDCGMPAAVHCIGDGTLHMALTAIEKAQTEHPLPDMRHSIVHCQITDEALLLRLRQLNAVVHAQPIFINYDRHIVKDRVGAELEQTSYAWKSMLELGVHVAGGSDSPVESFDVMKNIYCAVTRKGLDGMPQEGWLPQQKLSVEEAVYIFTMGGAYASYDERINGSVTVGKQADFAVIDRNIFTVNPEEIKDAQVVMTVLDGEIVYRK